MRPTHGPPFTSAGGHFNPDGVGHGEHAGDLVPLLINRDGTGQLRFTTDRFTIAQLLDVDGSALIVHAERDNLANIPTRSTRQRTASDPTPPPLPRAMRGAVSLWHHPGPGPPIGLAGQGSGDRGRASCRDSSRADDRGGDECSSDRDVDGDQPHVGHGDDHGA